MRGLGAISSIQCPLYKVNSLQLWSQLYMYGHETLPHYTSGSLCALKFALVILSSLMSPIPWTTSCWRMWGWRWRSPRDSPSSPMSQSRSCHTAILPPHIPWLKWMTPPQVMEERNRGRLEWEEEKSKSSVHTPFVWIAWRSMLVIGTLSLSAVPLLPSAHKYTHTHTLPPPPNTHTPPLQHLRILWHLHVHSYRHFPQHSEVHGEGLRP